MPDHTHVVAAIPPKIAVAKFVGQIKGVTSTKFNKMGLSHSLFWQDEYSAFSFDAKRLPYYIDYVQRQKEHHANDSTIAILERRSGEVRRLMREAGPIYVLHDEGWRAELDALEKHYRGNLPPATSDLRAQRPMNRA